MYIHEDIRTHSKVLSSQHFLILCHHLFTEVHLDEEKQVSQSPPELFMNPDDQFNLSCSHQIPRYDTILWYKRSPGDTALKLIGYISYTSPLLEPSFQSHFQVSGDGEKTAYLHILKARHPEDSGEYFAAASMHSDKVSDCLVQKPP